MSRNFIKNQIHVQEITHHITSGTRCGCTDDLDFIACFVQQLSKKFLGHFNGFSFGGNIVFTHNLMGLIDQCVFGGGTADINAQKNLLMFLKGSFFYLIGFRENGFLNYQPFCHRYLTLLPRCQLFEQREIRTAVPMAGTLFVFCRHGCQSHTQSPNGGIVRGYRQIRNIFLQGLDLKFI